MANTTPTLIILLTIISCTLFPFMGPSFSQITDTILPGQKLQHGAAKPLVSAGWKFTLGWFNGAAAGFRLGIWCESEEQLLTTFDRVIWVANHHTAIYDASASLTLDSDGTLGISYSGGGPLVLNSNRATGNVSATLLDSGNFVVREDYGNLTSILWQSFEYPTDTLLPWMKLGLNLKTGHNWTLNSPSSNIIDPGSLTLGLDPNGTSQLVMWYQEDIYWTSGLWQNGHFNSSSSLALNEYYNFTFVSNENERFFSFTAKTHKAISFPRLKIRGNQLYAPLPNSAALRELLPCSFYSVFSGCLDEQRLPRCRSRGDYLVYRYGVASQAGFILDESNKMDKFECRVKCLNNCSCVAFGPAIALSQTGCQIWSSGMNFTVSNSSIDSGLQVPVYFVESRKAIGSPIPREGRTSRQNSTTWWIWPIIAVGIELAVIVLCFLCYRAWKTLRAKGERKTKLKMLLYEPSGNTTASAEQSNVKQREKGKKTSTGLHLQLFSFECVAAATNNFSAANKLGEGGFGSVYKGELHGQEIAIKRLSRSSTQGLVEFKNELRLIAKLQHTNLVKLIGCCIDGEENILIYEYMPNKSLDSFLFDLSRKKLLDWKKRFNIIEGIAQRLLYLHKYSRLKVIHRDLKASNILLDDEMSPKISDFGMAKMFGRNEFEGNTNRIVGTYGYMSPEYAIKGIFSMKSDVFSFGVLLLEIVSGVKNNRSYHPECSLNLIGYAWELWTEGRGIELVDPTLAKSYHENQVLRCIHVGLLCVQDKPVDRPTMLDVTAMISNENISLSLPRPPAFFIERDSLEANALEGRTESCSINDVSISVLEAR